MTILSRIVASTIVCGGLLAGCFSADPAPATEEQTAQTEQNASGANTPLAQEREVTYYSEPAKINEVGFCSGPYRCYGPKGLRCTGIKTQWSTIEWISCE